MPTQPTTCPQCNNEYNNYEDVSFIAGHEMCIDCYEDKNTPNQPTANNLDMNILTPESLKKAEDLLSQQAELTYNRAELQPDYIHNNMKPLLTKGEITTCESLPHEPVITANNLEGFDNKYLKSLTGNEELKTKDVIALLLDIKQFISDLRKKDEEELIKRILLQWRTEPIIRAIDVIKKYYENK